MTNSHVLRSGDQGIVDLTVREIGTLNERVHKERPDTLLNLLRQMLTIRSFELKVDELVAEGEVRGPVHFSDGQEAVSVGVCSLLEVRDPMLCTYRGHAALIAKGSELLGLFSEVLGRANGVCRGKGGSMHLTDFQVGALGSFPVVGAHLPIALGAAFTSKYLKRPDVTVCFFGDGATNIGAFHEAMNLAAVWQLPILWVCENNFYGEYTPIAETTAAVSLAHRAAAYGIPSFRVDGNDVLAVREGSYRALALIRHTSGPVFIEAITYRQKNHAVRPDARPRPPEEVNEWLLRDPIRQLEMALLETEAMGERSIDELRHEVNAEVEAAAARALAGPLPEPDEIGLDVYA